MREILVRHFSRWGDSDGAPISMVKHEPSVLCSGNYPWNFPFLQVFRFFARSHNLCAGNNRHAPSAASNVFFGLRQANRIRISTKSTEYIPRKESFKSGLIVSSSSTWIKTGRSIVAHPAIKAVTHITPRQASERENSSQARSRRHK